MHNGPAILLIFLLCYVGQSLCTHIALKLRNAVALIVMDHVLQMLILDSLALISTAIKCKHWQTVVL